MVVYIIKTVMIDLGYSRNVPVKYKFLFFRTDDYILEFLSRIDVPKRFLALVPRSVLRGDKYPIFFSNLSIIPVRVYEGAIIGYLNEYNTKPKYYIKVYLRYPEITTPTNDVL